MAYTSVSKTDERKLVRVQLPSSALITYQLCAKNTIPKKGLLRHQPSLFGYFLSNNFLIKVRFYSAEDVLGDYLIPAGIGVEKIAFHGGIRDDAA